MSRLKRASRNSPPLKGSARKGRKAFQPKPKPVPPPKPTDGLVDDDGPLVDKGGRPFTYANKEQAMALLAGLGAIMATWKEAAAVLRINESTLARMFLRWPECKDAFESGKSNGKVSLRRNQFDLSKKNATMAIFLGLNYLDQKDLRQLHMGGKVNHDHKHTVLGRLLAEIDEEQRGAPMIEHRPDEFEAAGAAAVGPNDED